MLEFDQILIGLDKCVIVDLIRVLISMKVNGASICLENTTTNSTMPDFIWNAYFMTTVIVKLLLLKFNS